MAKKVRRGAPRVPWLVYPEDRWKNNWDIYVTVILITTCVYTPYAISFDFNSPTMFFVDKFIDVCFFIDMLIMFNTVYSNEDYKRIEDRCDIAKNYINGWFLVDFLAIIPIDDIMSAG
jgi:hypothetical protein